MLVLTFLTIISSAYGQKPDEVDRRCITIRDIDFKINDVYDESDSPNRLETALNFLHFKTRRSVVKAELLFRKGECLNPQLVEESARNLRALSIFSDAAISTVSYPELGVVDLLVTTKDRFTLRAEISASHNAGTTKQRLSFGDRNLFGLNKNLHYSQTTEDGENLSRIVYEDFRFLRDYSVNVARTNARDGVLSSYSMSKPFRSLSDKNAYGISHTKNEQDFVFSLDEGEELEIPQFYESESLSYQHEFGGRVRSKRLGFELNSSQQSYFKQLVSDQVNVPDRLERIDFDLAGTLTKREGFAVLTGVDSLIYREDIELGKVLGLGLGVQWREKSGDTEYHPKAQLRYRQTQFNGKHVLSSANIQYEGRFYAGHLKELNTTAFYHGYYFPVADQVWVAGLNYRYRYGRDTLSDPLRVGGDAGLRGYKAGTFTGNKSLILNFEHRRKLPFKSEKVAIGQAFFADSGFAWKQGSDMRLSDLKLNVGWGLRFDIPSIFGKDVLRLDIAVATDTGKVLFSIVKGQVFRYNELAENNQKDF